MKIVFFLACWKRPEITELCFMGLQRLMKHRSDVFESSAFAVISEKEMIPLCEKYGIDFIMHENNPVGMKKNAGLSVCLKKDFDYLIELGSDDLILNDLLDLYLPSMQKGIDFFGCKRLMLIDSFNGECRDFFFDPDLVQGLGRCMRKKMLLHFSNKIMVESLTSIISNEVVLSEGQIGFIDKSNADVFEFKGWCKKVSSTIDTHLWDSIDRGLDNNSTARIIRAGYKFNLVSTNEPLMADIKSDENIWGYNPEIGQKGDLEKFLSKVSQQEKAKFFSNMKILKSKRIEKAA